MPFYKAQPPVKSICRVSDKGDWLADYSPFMSHPLKTQQNLYQKTTVCL